MSSGRIVATNQAFRFNWQDYRTIEPSKQQVESVAEVLRQYSNAYDSLPEDEKKALGELCFKAGAFDLHVAREPNAALEKLIVAGNLLKGEKHSHAWAILQTAFARQQRLSKLRIRFNENKADFNEQAALFESKGINQLCDQILAEYTPELESNPEAAKLVGFAKCLKALEQLEMAYIARIKGEKDQLSQGLQNAEQHYREAIQLYEAKGLLDDQYARAKNRYAQILSELGRHDEARKIFLALDTYWKDKQDALNPYAARFYVSYADFLASPAMDNLPSAAEKYQKALELASATGDIQFAHDIGVKFDKVQEKISRAAEEAVKNVLINLAAQLTPLAPAVRDRVLESVAAFTLQGIVPMSGITIQQHVAVNAETVTAMNAALQKPDTFKARADATYAYKFAREATSGGVIPVYRDARTGDLYIGLICNTRNPNMYNGSAGYTEAPLPRWNGRLLANTSDVLLYNRAAVQKSATNTMHKAVEEAEGDWTEANYDYRRFRAGFAADGVALPEIDLSSLDSAERELREEMGLDVTQFPDRETMLIPPDNTVGISQGDAPGQLSNRYHQYLVFLGTLQNAPTLTAGDDVGIAQWLNVRGIERKSATVYLYEDKPLCEYLLRGLELGLKNLWQLLLAQTSTRRSAICNERIEHFSSRASLAARIEQYCQDNHIKPEGLVVPFLSAITKNRQQTYVGWSAQKLLTSIINIANYMLTADIAPHTFNSAMKGFLSPISTELLLMAVPHGSAASPTHFRAPSPIAPIAAAAAAVITAACTPGTMSQFEDASLASTQSPRRP